MTILDYPLPGPELQYWYTVSIPQDTGVYDLPVFAPRLFAPVNYVSAEPPIQHGVSEPNLGLLIAVLLILLLVRRKDEI